MTSRRRRISTVCGCAASPSQDPAHDDVMLGPMPPASCDPGTRPAAGKADCEPVGIASCADGFARADDGWGCEAIAPPGGCTNTKRARLGERSCLADVDCDAPFP